MCGGSIITVDTYTLLLRRNALNLCETPVNEHLAETIQVTCYKPLLQRCAQEP